MRHQKSGDSISVNGPLSSLSPHPSGSDLSQGHFYGHTTGMPMSLSPEFVHHQDSLNLISPPEGEYGCIPLANSGECKTNRRSGYPMLQHSASWDSHGYRTFPTISEDVSHEYTTRDQWKTPKIQQYSQASCEIQPLSLGAGLPNTVLRNEIGWLGSQRPSHSANDMGHINYSPHSSHHSGLMQDMTRRGSTFSYPSSMSMADHSGHSSLSEVSPNIPVSSHATHAVPIQYGYSGQFGTYSGQHQHTTPENLQPPDGYGYDATWHTDPSQRFS